MNYMYFNSWPQDPTLVTFGTETIEHKSSDETNTPFWVRPRFIWHKIHGEQGWCVYLQKHEILREMVDHHKQSTNTQTDCMHHPYVSMENACLHYIISSSYELHVF